MMTARFNKPQRHRHSPALRGIMKGSIGETEIKNLATEVSEIKEKAFLLCIVSKYKTSVRSVNSVARRSFSLCLCG